MFNSISRDSFRVDLLVPAIQTGATFAGVKVLGSLGQYVVSDRTALVVGTIASVVASFANNLFNKAYLYYAAIPFGIGAGVLAHGYIYPETALQQVLDVKGFLVIATLIAAVKLISDRVPFPFVKGKESNFLGNQVPYLSQELTSPSSASKKTTNPGSAGKTPLAVG